MCPPLLAELGLVQALRTGIQGATHRSRSTPHPTSTTGWCPAPIAAAIYYCCLEAVGNARKHTPSATISVRLRPDGDWLRVNVVDDGIGFDTTTNSTPRAAGSATSQPASVRSAAMSRSGSTPGHGTTVEASVPLPCRATPRPGGPAPHSQHHRPTPLGGGRAAGTRRRAWPASLPGCGRRCGPRGEYYHRTPYAPWLRTLAERLEGPPHIAVRAAAMTKPPGCADPPTDATAPVADPPDVALAAARAPPPRPDIHRTVHRPQRTARSTRPHRRHGRRAGGDNRAPARPGRRRDHRPHTAAPRPAHR